MILVAIDTFLWLVIGSSLVGVGSYEKYREHTELIDRYRRRVDRGGQH
jgi:hypothetical protein